jgi:hypothetical protein
MSQTPKIAGFLETSEADLTPLIALGVTPAKRLNYDCQRSATRPAHVGTGRSRTIVAFGELAVCDCGHG